MHVKNKETGKVETLPHGPAMDAVTAGTHEFVNGPSDSNPADFVAPTPVIPPPSIIVVQSTGTQAAPVASNAAALEAAHKRVVSAEAAQRGARTDADKAKAEAELKTAKEELAKLES